jgi:hypothetical protein
MRKLITLAALALVALPAAAAAQTSPPPTQNAAQLCRAERQAMGEQVFKMTYGTNANRSNAFGRCVSKKNREANAARTNASERCRAEREQLGEAAFNAKYGRNRNDRNAFGKCVSQHAQAEQQANQQATLRAARACRAERQSMGAAAFNAKYGTNRNDRNAFGKCVSQRARG